MGILTNLVLSIMHLALIVIDLLFLWTLTRLLRHHWNPAWLAALDAAGKPLLDWYTSRIEKAARHINQRTFSEKAILVMAVITLLLARLFLAVLFSRQS